MTWDEDDRRKVLARIQENSPSERCPNCGIWYEEWDSKKGGSPDAYVPHGITCPACRASAAHYSDAVKSRKDGSGVWGLNMTIVSKEESQRRQQEAARRKALLEARDREGAELSE